MNQANIRKLQNDVYCLYRQTARLNLYVQNLKRLDIGRLAAELKEIALALETVSTVFVNDPILNGSMCASDGQIKASNKPTCKVVKALSSKLEN